MGDTSPRDAESMDMNDDADANTTTRRGPLFAESPPAIDEEQSSMIDSEPTPTMADTPAVALDARFLRMTGTGVSATADTNAANGDDGDGDDMVAELEAHMATLSCGSAKSGGGGGGGSSNGPGAIDAGSDGESRGVETHQQQPGDKDNGRDDDGLAVPDLGADARGAGTVVTRAADASAVNAVESLGEVFTGTKDAQKKIGEGGIARVTASVLPVVAKDESEGTVANRSTPGRRRNEKAARSPAVIGAPSSSSKGKGKRAELSIPGASPFTASRAQTRGDVLTPKTSTFGAASGANGDCDVDMVNFAASKRDGGGSAGKVKPLAQVALPAPVEAPSITMTAVEKQGLALAAALVKEEETRSNMTRRVPSDTPTGSAADDGAGRAATTTTTVAPAVAVTAVPSPRAARAGSTVVSSGYGKQVPVVRDARRASSARRMSVVGVNGANAAPTSPSPARGCGRGFSFGARVSSPGGVARGRSPARPARAAGTAAAGAGANVQVGAAGAGGAKQQVAAAPVAKNTVGGTVSTVSARRGAGGRAEGGVGGRVSVVGAVVARRQSLAIGAPVPGAGAGAAAGDGTRIPGRSGSRGKSRASVGMGGGGSGNGGVGGRDAGAGVGSTTVTTG